MFEGACVLVTGGTGSFGQQFVRHCLGKPVRKVIVYSRDEYKQWCMAKAIDDGRVRYFLGDVRDSARLSHVVQQADLVVHAAALKHVSAMEYNPDEAVRTNVVGTQNVISAVIDSPVRKAVFLSTDKAVNPANLYGATKMVAEKVWIASNVHRPVFSFVRYGNVMESRGGVLSVWREAIEAKRTVDLTHEKMTRFWMSYSMAIAAVEEAIRQPAGLGIVWKAKGFLLTDLLAAIMPDEVVLRVTGRQPGEKMHEVLLSDDEVPRTFDAGECYHVRPSRVMDEAIEYRELPGVPEGFRYTSEGSRLTVEELKALCG